MLKRLLGLTVILVLVPACSTLNHYSVQEAPLRISQTQQDNTLQTCAIHSIALEFCRFESIEDACVLVLNQQKGAPVVELKNQLNYWKTYFKGRTVLNYQSCTAQYRKAHDYLRMISSQ